MTRAWANPMRQYWVSKGWIYFQIDNRGSYNRGKAFEDHIYHAMGTVEVEDQATAARWLQKQAFVDPKKIAISGWSYGGYMTPEDAREVAERPVRGRNRRSASDEMGAVRHRITPSVTSATRRSIRSLTSRRTRSRTR